MVEYCHDDILLILCQVGKISQLASSYNFKFRLWEQYQRQSLSFMVYAAWCHRLKQGSNVRNNIRRKRKQAAKTVRDYGGYTNKQQKLNERRAFRGRINIGLACWADGGWQSLSWTYRWHWLCSTLFICHLPPRPGHYWKTWGQKVESPSKWRSGYCRLPQHLQSYLIFSRDKKKIGEWVNKCFMAEMMTRLFGGGKFRFLYKEYFLFFSNVYPERRERAPISVCELLCAFTYQRVISITEWRKADRTQAGLGARWNWNRLKISPVITAMFN